ncbi:deoxyribodipyrimidine photo-lyase [Sphaerochaeta sp.]|uniref:deoxyribodipyrimidine photo-lyase n=1 Tax=Sphaerochaeta sp. TaxID=1972642 RepID=UPI002FC7C87F
MIDAQRIKHLNAQQVNPQGSYVLYWMQASQRVVQNEALSHAIATANSLRKPLVVYFGIAEAFNEANERHYRFLFEGLKDVQEGLLEQGISLWVYGNGVVEGLMQLAENVVALVTDCAYGRLEQSWRREVARRIPCAMVQVEANVIVPVETASLKEEYSAATLRRKIEPMIGYFAQKQEPVHLQQNSLSIQMPFALVDLDDIPGLLASMHLQKKGGDRLLMRGGEKSAQAALSHFIEHGLALYAEKRNDPGESVSSHLSGYLHFGQISPITVYLAIKDEDCSSVPAFLEQLVVRRELACNFVHYNPLYDQYAGLPLWAKASLESHASDPRPVLYTLSELEGAHTHDRYWNAAQQELVALGTMHNYMRMYWGKKILEWSADPEEAFQTALYLNNTYQLDGRDPNGYAGVAWCFGKHDRPWTERTVFGNIRYMNDKGLERKFSMQRYLDRIQEAIQI